MLPKVGSAAGFTQTISLSPFTCLCCLIPHPHRALGPGEISQVGRTCLPLHPAFVTDHQQCTCPSSTCALGHWRVSSLQESSQGRLIAHIDFRSYQTAFHSSSTDKILTLNSSPTHIPSSLAWHTWFYPLCPLARQIPALEAKANLLEASRNLSLFLMPLTKKFLLPLFLGSNDPIKALLRSALTLKRRFGFQTELFFP